MQDFFSQIDLFSHLTSGDYALLKEHAKLTTVHKGELIFRNGDPSSNLYLLKQGSVKLYNIRRGSEKEEITCLMGTGEVFCLAPLLSREQFHVNAQALEESEMIIIPELAIQALIRQSHPFAQRVIRFLAKKECDLCEEVCDLSLSTTKERLAKYLFREYERNRHADSFPLPLNQSQLASYLGTVRETLSRDLADLKKAHIIKAEKGLISVLNPGELQQVGGCFQKPCSK
ncbi:MAG: Crp/Fnr family transcriptional regulator [bacterium]|nr:Crp/Fnr family transcriptional regulator [bacterium]